MKRPASGSVWKAMVYEMRSSNWPACVVKTYEAENEMWKYVKKLKPVIYRQSICEKLIFLLIVLHVVTAVKKIVEK